MELALRVHRPDGVARDLIVGVDGSHSVSDVARELADVLDVADTRTVVSHPRSGRVLPPDLTVADAGIVSGDDLVFGPLPPSLSRDVRSRRSGGRAVRELAIVGGPDAGANHSLRVGVTTIGRNPSSDVVVNDPTVSRTHVDLDVDELGHVWVVPRLGVANRVLVDGVAIEGTTPIEAGATLSLGSTRCVVRSPRSVGGGRVDHLGHVEFHRTPYRCPVLRQRRSPPLGEIPERREPRRFQWLSALAPLAAGLTFFAFSRQPQFLVLTLVSPLVMIANGVEDRRSGRRRFVSESATFRARLVDWRAEIDQALDAERAERTLAAPDLADLIRRAEDRSADLWPRGRGASDFLCLRLGLGSIEPSFSPSIGDEGDLELREAARDVLVGVDRLHDVPIITELATVGVLGLHGGAGVVDGVACSLITQAACLHSPEDLVIAAVVDPTRPIAAWLKWLPHVRSTSSPLAGDHVATDQGEARSLIGRLLDVVQQRAADPEREDRRWPWVLVVVQSSVRPDAADIARLLDRCPLAGVSVMWLGADNADVPRQAAQVLVIDEVSAEGCVATRWSTDPTVTACQIDLDMLTATRAEAAARALAPLRDASTVSRATSMPRTAPLLDIVGVGALSSSWVRRHWQHDDGYHLRFPIGVGADGPVVLDLVDDGPHALIGGTSGAGKSELVQSIVASLAVHHRPDRLNFLFVDYKGGASSNAFGRLPHTVGYVTNLSAQLSLRALTSLRAELERRMRLMEGRAKDLAEMLVSSPEDAPPSLVIVVDEFATLANEVPDFVDGIVDIAQRGRSLGIHLILATQRPAGSVNENILANTNLRISLRMLDRADSTAVIGSGDAADIPVPLRGRAFARLGPRILVPFQSAYCGAPLSAEAATAPVLVSPFERSTDSPNPAGPAGSTSGRLESTSARSGLEPGRVPRTHLDALLDAVEQAACELSLPPPLPPWRDELGDTILLGDVLCDPMVADTRSMPGRCIAVGMLDLPEFQDQRPAVVDLEQGGGWLIFGSGGAGKTTLLRTVAMSATLTAASGDVEIVGFDFDSRGLSSIIPLPTVVDVVPGDDLEHVTRHLAGLSDELDRRRSLLATAHAEHLTAYNARHDPLSRIIVMVDGYGGFVSTFTGPGSSGSMSVAMPLDRWVDVLHNLVVEGRQVGIHVVITSDRRSAIPQRLHSAVANRLVLRHADEQGYADHGIPSTRGRQLDLRPGQGLWQASIVVQVASVSADPSGSEQARALQALAADVPAVAASSLASEPLPTAADIACRDLAQAGGRRRFALGIGDRVDGLIHVDMAWSNFLVGGPPRSGRSTTLLAAVAGLAAANRVWGIGPASSPIGQMRLHDGAFGRGDDIAALVDQLEAALRVGDDGASEVLVIDDLDLFDDIALASSWERIARMEELRIAASVEARSLSGYTGNPLVAVLKRARRMLVLQVDDSNEVLQLTGVKSPARPGVRMVPGRGVYVSDREPVVLQVARPRPSMGSPA